MESGASACAWVLECSFTGLVATETSSSTSVLGLLLRPQQRAVSGELGAWALTGRAGRPSPKEDPGRALASCCCPHPPPASQRCESSLPGLSASSQEAEPLLLSYLAWVVCLQAPVLQREEVVVKGGPAHVLLVVTPPQGERGRKSEGR